ncbi:hypothetical protein MBHK15_120008 [Marinobacter salarius]|nr:hypothetical protein MBHK15_120008 [Marinobacter salarius]
MWQCVDTGQPAPENRDQVSSDLVSQFTHERRFSRDEWFLDDIVTSAARAAISHWFIMLDYGCVMNPISAGETGDKSRHCRWNRLYRC